MKTNLSRLRRIIRRVLAENLSALQDDLVYPLRTRENAYNIEYKSKTHTLPYVEQVYVPDISAYANLISHEDIEAIAREGYERTNSANRIYTIPRLRSVIDIGCGFYFYAATTPSAIQISGTRDYQEDEEIPLKTEFLIFYTDKDLHKQDDMYDTILVRPPNSSENSEFRETEELIYDRANSIYKRHGSIDGCDFLKYYKEGKRLRDRPKKREGEMISPVSPQIANTPSEDTGLDLPDFVNTSPVKPYDSPFKGGLDKARNPFKED